MSLLEGHPILAEIRQGFKLRPTKMVDKSCPVIAAEGEEPVIIKYERKTPPPVIYTPQPKAQSKSICRVPQEALNIKFIPRTPSPQPQWNPGKSSGPPPKNKTLLKLGGEITDRGALLSAIKGGIKLRKTTTVDKSGLILDDEYLEEIEKRKSGNTSLCVSTNSLNSNSLQAIPSSSSNRSSEASDSDSESVESATLPVSKPVIRSTVPFVPAANAPPPPPPPPMGSTAFSAPPPPPPPSMPMKMTTTSALPPPPPPPPPPMGSSILPPPPPPMVNIPKAPSAPKAQYSYKDVQASPSNYTYNKIQETQEQNLTFDSEKYVPPPRQKVEYKKPDAIFDGIKVTKESIDSEVKKGLAASRIKAFAQLCQVDESSAKPPMPKILYPTTSFIKKKDEEKSFGSSSSEKTSRSSSISSIDRSNSKNSDASSKGYGSQTSSKKDPESDMEMEAEEILPPPKPKVTSEVKQLNGKVPSGKLTQLVNNDAKFANGDAKLVNGNVEEKPKKLVKKKTSIASDDEKPKKKIIKKKATVPAPVPSFGLNTPSASFTFTTKPAATINSPANKFSVPMTINTDVLPPPPMPKSTPPKVSPTLTKTFKEPTNTGLGPYKYNGKPSPNSISSTQSSPNSTAYQTAISSATSSYSSIPKENPSPISGPSSANTSPRSTSGESGKENNEISTSITKKITEHSKNFDKIRASFSDACKNDTNNNKGIQNGIVDCKVNGKIDKLTTITNGEIKNEEKEMPKINGKTVKINAPWYKKEDYPEEEKPPTLKKTIVKKKISAIKTINNVENSEMLCSTNSLKKNNPIKIGQR